MLIGYFIILLLPIILYVKGNTAVLVFIVMNSIISLLMQYTKIQIRAIIRFNTHENKAKELLANGASEDDAFEDLLGKVDLDEHIPMPRIIKYVAIISG